MDEIQAGRGEVCTLHRGDTLSPPIRPSYPLAPPCTQIDFEGQSTIGNLKLVERDSASAPTTDARPHSVNIFRMKTTSEVSLYTDRWEEREREGGFCA